MDKEEAKLLREQGYSYTEISKKLGVSREYVGRITRNVNFSQEGNQRYFKEVKGIIKKINLQADRLTNEKTRILGHLLFDGGVYNRDYHKIAKYVNASKELVTQFIKDIQLVYGLCPTSIEEIKGKNNLICYNVTFKSKKMHEDLMNYFPYFSTSNSLSIIPQKIMNASKEIKLEFLRSFFEDEGSISFNGRISGDLRSKRILNQISDLLNEFNLNFKFCEYREDEGFMYKIYLPKSRENLELFLTLGLFEKSIITHGKNFGRKKIEVLKESIGKLKNPTNLTILDSHSS